MAEAPYDRIASLAASYSIENLRVLAANWRQAEENYVKDYSNREYQTWWRKERQKEAQTARLNAEAFEAAIKLKESPVT